MDLKRLSYSILDPTGNITALVESGVPADRQPETAAALMRRHPEVEQVGFVRFPPAGTTLRMAGGEFCGNATMCAAALTLLRRGAGEDGTCESVTLAVSGAAEPVTVELRRESASSFSAAVCMPPPPSIEQLSVSCAGTHGTLPFVSMEGISHLVIERDSGFFSLKEDRPAAETAVRELCAALGCDGLGLMFLDQGKDKTCLTPLVYIPGSSTVFWENSCASGTAAVGCALAARTGSPVDLTLSEPGGELRVSCAAGSPVILRGRVRLLAHFGPDQSR